MNRVWIRGVGAVTALGATWPDSARALAEGRSAVKRITRFDVAGYPSTVAAAIDDEIVAVEPGRARAPSTDTDRRLPLARRAAAEAWRMADVAPGARIGVFLGAESGRASYATVLALSRAAGGGKRFDHEAFGERARPLAGAIDAAAVSPAAVTSALAGEYDARGPTRTISLACASGAAAIAEATRSIRRGECDVAIAGGVGADVDPFMLAGFGILGALSLRGVSCPFDARRDGFVVGEGAAIVVLAAERGAATVELAGIGRTLDAHHLTAPDPDGDGAARAMSIALADARLDEVGYVQAHGTSTPLNDAVEAAAILRVLGDRIARTRVASVKGALGHWIAGAGALGALCAYEAVTSGTLLPTAGLEQPDPRCDLPHVLTRASHAPTASALVNAFAFGGANACLVLRKA